MISRRPRDGTVTPLGRYSRTASLSANFAALHHVSQEQRREHLGDGANLEDGLRRDLRAIGPRAPIRREGSPTWREPADNRAGPLLGFVDTFREGGAQRVRVSLRTDEREDSTAQQQCQPR